MHIHASVLDAAILLAKLIILGAGWRTVAARLGGTATGRAMSFIW